MDKLTKDQVRGVDLIVKSVMKKYPFIKGGELSGDYEKFSAILYIDLNIDLFQLTEENGHRLSPPWIQEYEKYGPNTLITSTLSGYIYRDRVNVNDDIFEIYYKLSNEIRDDLNKMYEFLPDNMKVLYMANSDSSFKTYVDVYVGDYKQYK